MLRTIAQVAEELGVSSEHVLPYGRGKAKIDLAALDRPRAGKGNLVLVSAINPTPAGEGKTTVSIGLAMALRRLGRRTALALREPSLGPVFGLKGGATGGGRTQIAPATDINLHFNGDMHAITSAHNLLAAMVDNDLHFGGARSGIDSRHVTWGRALDMNDRALRDVIIGLGGPAGGVPRQTRFDITAASEVMAILCLATGRSDLRARLARIVVGRSAGGKLITADNVGAADAMAALLNDAIDPNLVQTLEGGPALVHGGPFGNIAHGCSSLLATRLAMHQVDDVITEAGFGFDLGAEKFLHIKCRAGGIWPRCVLLVATVRALKMHGGVAVAEAAQPNMMALEAGLAHLDQHLLAADAFGLTPVVAINVFHGDGETELARVEAHCRAHGIVAARSTGYANGGAGALDLGRAVAAVLDDDRAPVPTPRSLYRLDDSYEDKLRIIARRVYGADDAVISPAAATSFARIEDAGHGGLPVCVAKTHLSLSDDPRRTGAPKGFVVTVREARLSAGAGFVVALLGDVLTMPGLPREPAALRVRVDAEGRIRGLMQNE